MTAPPMPTMPWTMDNPPAKIKTVLRSDITLPYYPPSKKQPSMPRFQAVVVSLAFSFGYASAGGCHPVFTPGAAYSEGNQVSQSITTFTPIVWTACTVSPTCTTGWIRGGGVSTTGTYNYVCISPHWCSNVGYAPGGVYSDLAWKREDAVCSVSSPWAAPYDYFVVEYGPTSCI
jgi:hypothetical protein